MAWIFPRSSRIAAACGASRTACSARADRLRQARAERESYAGPWLPEPLVAEASPGADEAAELASDLSVALLALLHSKDEAGS
jgi:RNA polymerase sigma-70 factor (ECF subfamily)